MKRSDCRRKSGLSYILLYKCIARNFSRGCDVQKKRHKKNKSTKSNNEHVTIYILNK